MGYLNFRRRIKICPGLYLNLGKRGISTSIGPRGAKITFGGQRGIRATVGIPGTGISYTVTDGLKGVGKSKPPRRGYTLEKVVVCPRCKSVSLYDPAMIGEELHCPQCNHLFYLGRNVKNAWVPPLVKCKKCGRLIDKSAKICPLCGAKNRRLNGCGCVLIIFLSFILLAMICGVISAILGK